MKSTFIEGRKHRRSSPTAIDDANQKELVAWACVFVRRSKTEARYPIYDTTHAHPRTSVYICIYTFFKYFICVPTYMFICIVYVYVYISIYVRYYMIYVPDPSRAFARFYDGCLQWISSVQVGWMFGLCMHLLTHNVYL